MHIQFFKRYFHLQLFSGSLLNRKTVNGAIKHINNSSLTKKEINLGLSKEAYDTLPEWKKQNIALKKKFNGERWNPLKKLSRLEMNNVKLLKSNFPDMTATQLANQFKVSPETIRRILKSKWTPNEDEIVKLEERWKRRGEKINEMYKENLKVGQGPRPDLIASNKIIIGLSRNVDTYRVTRSQKQYNKFPNPKTKQNNKQSHNKNKLFLLQGKNE
ncbi:hypothetical protein TPHA_0O01800 [Tetrapisispora phaffii CBS 4417]|uniref:Required for respiratory growth protein 9, mitochondrial n=1 Tax=Tetrapisispora phaffii (strain ATCC 24235 / CBS 4417 / NBRC 1672 / NRRL Y-8282 / UCD 70-5) TaxID=1071381 RepID=G8C1W9_TETPH|nr:hypothetical protein TPHA_0O01800 [Tetrapisispora phaffii CBS 4417]CCE66147.1 hypothetical protein TPHA_0O01800 [Tetrapisispora phaffii CBS 4417]